MKNNLLNEAMRTDAGNGMLHDWSTDLGSCSFSHIEVIFRNQEKKLIGIINEYKNHAVFGCVAWLTSVPILNALSGCKHVQIIVQKEDFLRPDVGVNNRNKWKNELQALYRRVKCGFARYEFKEPIRNLSVCCDPSVEAIRCVGNYNSDKSPAFPRMHHKFLVFCKITERGNDIIDYKPVAVWTGSFNLTHNATMSFENNLYLVDQSGENYILNGYLYEHHQIFALSEQLNWTSEWVEPEFRIGT
jgi:hypothetical protein